MRIFSIHGTSVTETLAPVLPQALLELRLPAQGYLWLACTRSEFEQMQAQIQVTLERLCGSQLMDLHVADLLNRQLPSRYDYTLQYDLLVFRRLAASAADTDVSPEPMSLVKRSGPPILRRIDTSPVGFVVFDRVLLTVHPQDAASRDSYAQRLLAAGSNQTSTELNTSVPDGRSAGARGVPSSPADLMLRIVNQMVDSFLALRRELSHQLDHWQSELLNPRTRFANWSTLLNARLSLHQLDEVCEDQRSAIEDWIEALKGWPETELPLSRHERDMLQVRSRDVLEHIERVVHHVHQLERNIEAAVQIHFNAQSHRTNEIMRTLTALTAIFLPMNFFTGFFGMNFEFLPLIHQQRGLWWAIGLMLALAVVLLVVFWRKRYLTRFSR
ncbi:MAG: magnesium transporter CorA family protein [Rhodoferax sp.]